MTRLAGEVTLPTSKKSSSSVELTISRNVRSFEGEKALTVAIIDSRQLTRECLMKLLDDDSQIGNIISLSCCSELLDKDLEVLSEVEVVLLNIGGKLVEDRQVVDDIYLLIEALNSPIIIVGDRDDSLQVRQALRRGARGYIPTTLTSQILIRALRLVQAGGAFVPACALTETPSRHPIAVKAETEAVAPGFCRMTQRQCEVLNLLRQGMPNKLIAYELGMSESTVKAHVQNIIRKMGVSNRTEASFLASAVDRNFNT